MSIGNSWFQQVKRGADHYQFGKHHPTYVDVVGQRFGKLVVEAQPPGKGVHCRCDCGRTHIEKNTVDLRRGTRKSCGICTNFANPTFRKEEDAIILKWAGYKSIQEIADLITELGYRQATVHTVKNRRNAINRHRQPNDKLSLRRKGELYPHAKGSDHDVELCRRLYDEGLRPKEIAEKMEMSRSHVSSIVYYISRTEPAYGWNEADTQPNKGKSNCGY